MQHAPAPCHDWISQRELADILGISQRTASLWAKAGKLERFVHTFPGCCRRKYSRNLLQRELELRWAHALERSNS